MHAVLRVLAFVLVAVSLAMPALPAAAAGKRVAMVVGNSAYQNTNALPNTLNDAKAVAASLERLGFVVHTSYDEPQMALLAALSRFSADLAGAEAGLFYYAGHGIQVGNENYILPVDIRIENELSLRYDAVSLTDVLDKLEELPEVAIVVLDACRDNPFTAQLNQAEGRSVAATRGLARIVPKGNGTLVAYAAAPGAVASDGTGDHSPYTKALLAEMEQPGVEVALVFRRVAGRVIEETNGGQRPELLVRLVDEFYLAGVAAPPQGPPATAPTAPVLPAEVAAPVDVATIAPVGPTEDRTTIGNREGRPALWGYAATLVDSPYDLPLPRWEAPARQSVAETEPNSSFGTAQPVGAGDEVTIAISPRGDHDWLRFAVGQGGRLTVRAPSPPAEIDPVVRLLNANGDEVAYWVGAPRPGGELFAEFDLPRAGTYSLQFADGNNDADSATAFAVSLDYAVAADPYEPNDRIDLARHLPLDGVAPVALTPRGDNDWFKFTAPSPGALVVSFTQTPEEIDTAFRLLNADGAEQVYWQTAPRPGGDNVGVLELPRPGVYYLQVVDGNNDASSVAAATLMTRFAPSPDAYEPNNTLGSAMPVADTGSSTLAIFPRGDNDYLEVALAQPGELSFEVRSPPQNLDLVLRVLDASGNEAQYWTFAPRPGGDLTGSFDAARPGRYFLQLADNNNDGSSVEPVVLDLSFRASLDAFEPNDSIGAARPLTLGGSVPITMLPRGDVDWFRVSVDQPGELRVTIDEGPENLDFTYRVVNADWNELAYWVPAYRKGGLTEGMADLPRAGTYYLEVRDGANDDRSIEPATLTTSFTPTPGSNEPNDSFGEATQVEIDGVTMAHILPRGDADWHVFHASGPGQLDVAVTEVPAELDVTFRLLNADRTEVQYWIAAPRPGGDTTGTIAIPAAGWYWLEIRDGANDQRSPLPFKVTRTFRPG